MAGLTEDTPCANAKAEAECPEGKEVDSGIGT